MEGLPQEMLTGAHIFSLNSAPTKIKKQETLSKKFQSFRSNTDLNPFQHYTSTRARVSP